MIGLREDQQMREQLITYLNAATAGYCGSGLARDSGWPVSDAPPDTPTSRASPLPQWRKVGVRGAAGSAASTAAG